MYISEIAHSTLFIYYGLREICGVNRKIKVRVRRPGSNCRSIYTCMAVGGGIDNTISTKTIKII